MSKLFTLIERLLHWLGWHTRHDQIIFLVHVNSGINKYYLVRQCLRVCACVVSLWEKFIYSFVSFLFLTFSWFSCFCYFHQVHLWFLGFYCFRPLVHAATASWIREFVFFENRFQSGNTFEWWFLAGEGNRLLQEYWEPKADVLSAYSKWQDSQDSLTGQPSQFHYTKWVI